MGIDMRYLLPVIGLCAVGLVTHAQAQTAQLSDAEIAPLADVISGMSETEITQMEQTVIDVGSLTSDVELVIETAVSEAVRKGAISMEALSDSAVAQQIANANAEFFDFDILDEIATIIAEGEFTEAQIRSTLEGFNNLSDADKALVGQYNFEADASNTLYQQVSAAGKTIIANQMPVLTEEDDDGGSSAP
jgi:hypothetical protein